MAYLSRVELLLDGLNCASCADKIERRVKEVQGISSVSLNFITKTMLIEVEEASSIDTVTAKVKEIVRNLEPHVVVREKKVDRTTKKAFLLMGLICSSCAKKIEEKLKGLKGVKSVYIDLGKGKLVIEANEKKISEISRQAEEIIKSIQPGIRVIDEQQDVPIKHAKTSRNLLGGSHRRKFARLLMGALLLAAAVVFRFNPWVEAILFLSSYVVVGGEILLRAAKNVIRGQVFDENFLMSIATLGAFAIREYPEGVAVMLFYQVGELLQQIAVNRSRRSIASLMDIRPDYANLVTGNQEKKVSPEEVRVGDCIKVKPGERIPLDGKVIEGESMVDTSALTGESVPREVRAGSDVLGGFINKNSVLTIEVTKEFGESTVAKILDLVENAVSRKAPTENFITKFARYYTPAVVFIALGLAVIPPMVIEGADFSDWVYRSLVFLVVSCPCALVVSIPLGFFGGIGGASRNGILVKGGNYLEALNNVEIVAFDKTGTLTKGVFKVAKVTPTAGVTEGEVLEYAAFAESFSNHPIAVSILNAYHGDVNKDLVESYDEISGHGIRAFVNGKEVLAGNSRLMKKYGVRFSEVGEVGSVVYVAVDREYKGSIVISDHIREDAVKAVSELKALGVKKVVMLTGDHRSVGLKVAKQLNMDNVYAELLPDQKVERVEMLERQKGPKGKLIFVGDGINDAPVLARADIGVAMGGLGSDAAIEAADVVLMTDEPSKLVSAIIIAKRARSIVWQNIVISLVVKAAVLILGAGGIATMWEAVFADVGVALIAVLNALRTIKIKV